LARPNKPILRGEVQQVSPARARVITRVNKQSNKRGQRMSNNSARRSRTSRAPRQQMLEPRAMSTIQTSGPVDPPQTSTNIVGIKRIRKKIQLAAGVGSLDTTQIGACLPLNSAEFRIFKLSAWASASANSLLSVVFPASTGIGTGDNSAWTDEGTQGSVRPQIHLIPNFAFRDIWFNPTSSLVIATFGGTASDLLVVDITLQYRTSQQSCPALDYLRTLCDSDVCDGTPPDDPDTSESESATYVDNFELR